MLLCGELVGLTFVGLGLWHALSTRRWKLGALIAAVGVAWTAVCLWVIIPAVGGGPSPFYGHYEAVGGSPVGLLRTVFTDPGAIADELLTSHDLTYVGSLAVPLLGAFAAAPVLAFAAAPQLLLNLLSGWPATASAREHYTAVVIPFLVAASVIAIAKLKTEHRRCRVAAAIVGICALATLLDGPWPGPPRPAERRRAAALEAISLVPPDAPVSTTNRAGAYLSERRYVYLVPVLGRAEWVVIDRKDAYMGFVPGLGPIREAPYPKRLARFERRIAADADWRVVYDRNDVAVYRRVATT
jgi:hypothetical protein